MTSRALVRLVCVLVLVGGGAACASLVQETAPLARPTATAEPSPEPDTNELAESAKTDVNPTVAAEPALTPTAAQTGDSEPPEPGYPEPLDGTVPIDVRWILDGDSVEADTPWGNVEVRLLGINANEQGECFGQEAKDALIDRLARDEAELWVEVHETYGPDRDEYGRLLGYIWQDGRLINLDQVSDGYAVARSPWFHPLEATLDDAETTARESKVGMWSPTACGSATTSKILIGELNFDAAGRDDENPNGEWIELINDGTEPVDLGGWMIRDESTRHRYEFPATTLLAAGGRVRLRSGCGTDNPDSNPMELFWCDSFGPVWSNSGDTAIVQDPAGNIVASTSYDSIYD